MKQPIQIFEHERLCANDKTYFATESEGVRVIEKLWQFNDVNNNIYFTAIRNGVKFNSYVGVIQIGGTTIEILPKADKEKSLDSEKKIWHDVLLKMLAKCKKIKITSVSEASLRKRHHSLLDLYFELFLEEVNYLIDQGLIKKYHNDSKNLTVLKGRLQFAKNIQQNLVHKERFYTTHQVYNYDHLINQILYKALLVLKSITINTSLSDKINRTLCNFPEIQNRSIVSSDFNSLGNDRKTHKYNEALKIAKMILLNYSPDIKGGNEHMIALLFDMNKLWEEFVYRTLAKHQTETLKISFQDSDKFWENKFIRPDIVLTKIDEDRNEEKIIIDTKWKVIDPKKPSDDDLKQMYAYNMYWQASKSMLLYPSSNPQVTSFGRFHKGKENDNLCKLGFINVLKGDTLNSNLGIEIFELLDID